MKANHDKIRDQISRYTSALGTVGGGNREILWQPLYDSMRLESGPFRGEFFSRPVGLPPETPKTHEDTNLYLANQLTGQNEFLVTSIGVYFVPNIDWVENTQSRNLYDALHVLGCGFLEFGVQMRTYLKMAPLGAVPPQFPMYWARDEKALAQMILHPTKVEGESVDKTVIPFELKPIYIQAMSCFWARITIDNAFKLSSPGKLGVMLDGYLIRQEF